MKEALVERTLRASERYRRRIVARTGWGLREREGNCCRCRDRDWLLGGVGAGGEASFWALGEVKVLVVKIRKL
jgi:hypothetical protein